MGHVSCELSKAFPWTPRLHCLHHSQYTAAAANSLQSCPTLRPHRRQPTRLPHPWDSPGSILEEWKKLVRNKNLHYLNNRIPLRTPSLRFSPSSCVLVFFPCRISQILSSWPSHFWTSVLRHNHTSYLIPILYKSTRLNIKRNKSNIFCPIINRYQSPNLYFIT